MLRRKQCLVIKDAAPGIACRVLRTVEELEGLTDLWQNLARNTTDPNIYYEPWMMLPALRLWCSEKDVIVLFLFGENPDCTTGPQILYGMAPFERQKTYRGIPARTLRLLRPPFTRVSTPLIHKAFVRETISAMLDWLATNSDSGSLVEFRFMTGDSRVSQELHQQTTDRHWTTYQSESTIRALWKPRENAEAYLDAALRGRRQKEYQRLWNRLCEAGPTEFRLMGASDDPKTWISSFMELEAQGWKGREGTALTFQEKDRRYIEETALGAHKHGQLMMLGLFHQNRPIALKLNYLTGRRGFAIKIAFDETFAKYSPGILLEMENIRRMHAMPQLEDMDSTADTEHPMINRLWLDRRTMETFLVAPGTFWGSLIAAAFPLLRWMKWMKSAKGRPHVLTDDK